MSSVVLIGFGNVGQHLGLALHRAGHSILQVFTQKPLPNNAFAQLLPKTQWLTQLNQIATNAQFYLIAVPDDAISLVASKMPPITGMIAHTSGATPLTALGNRDNIGIFYPLQTFTKQQPVNFKQIPFCIHANTQTGINNLQNLAHTLSPLVYGINDEQRRILHIAAVFANNFTNHLFAIANQICTQHQVPFEVMKPLIAETCQKVQTNLPQNIQTGPAKRADYQTIINHLSLLQNQPAYAALYKELTMSILTMYELNTHPIANFPTPDI